MYNWVFVKLFHLKTIHLGGITDADLFSLLILNFNLNLQSYNQFHNILDFPMFYQIFLSSQVNRWANITYKHGIYELPHELSKDLRS